MAASVIFAQAKDSARVYVKIEGQTKGVFKGEARRIIGDNFIDVLKYNYEVTSPRDSATGLPTGRRQQMAVTITKAIDAANPQIYQALINNKDLKTVTIDFTTSTTDGKEITYFEVVLKDATVSDIHQHLNQAPAVPAVAGDHSVEPMEDVSFTFRQITLTSSVGQTAASDSWAAESK
jgi:type VI secretion system secreted protein Hcp